MIQRLDGGGFSVSLLPAAIEAHFSEAMSPVDFAVDISIHTSVGSALRGYPLVRPRRCCAAGLVNAPPFARRMIAALNVGERAIFTDRGHLVTVERVQAH